MLSKRRDLPVPVDLKKLQIEINQWNIKYLAFALENPEK